MSFTLDLHLKGTKVDLGRVELALSGRAMRVQTEEWLFVLDGVVFGHDAQSLAACISERGLSILNQIDGHFVAVWVSAAVSHICIHRDHLGRRTLFFSKNAASIRISNQPRSFEHCQTVQVRRVASYLSLKPHVESETFFEHVTEAVPGTTRIQVGDEPCHHTGWTPETETYAELTFPDQVNQLDRLIHQSLHEVYGAYRPTKVGIMLSGGMDSSSIAAYAREFGSLTAFSWTFDHEDMDESPEFRATAKHLGLPLVEIAIQVGTASLLPLPQSLTFSPDLHIFREIKQQVYAMAQNHGIDVLLNGVWGDQLFRPLHRYQSSWRKRVRQWHKSPRRKPWYKSTASPPNPLGGISFLRPEQAQLILGSQANMNDSWENLLHTDDSLEIVSPFRDKQLVEFALGVRELAPYERYSKPHLRALTAGKLPELVARRTRRTSLHPYFEQRLAGSQQKMIKHLSRSQEILSYWIQPRYLKQWCSRGPSRVHQLPFWLCHSLVQWLEETQASMPPRLTPNRP